MVSYIAPYCCDEDHEHKLLAKKKINFIFHLPVYSPSWRDIRRDTQAGQWRTELKHRPGRNTAYCLVPHDFLSLLSYTTQDSCLWVALPAMWWASSISHLSEKYLDLPWDPSDRGIFLSWSSSFQMTLTCVNLTKRLIQDTCIEGKGQLVKILAMLVWVPRFKCPEST